MESTWHLLPGQTLENTKISDRTRALHVTSKAWGSITKHLDRTRLIQEALAKEQAHKKALKEGSEAMTKRWPNSIENIRLRKEEERNERIVRKKEDKVQRFYKLREEQEVVRKTYVEKMRRKAFLKTGFPKDLNSALLLSHTLNEREKQKQLADFIRRHHAEEEKKFADKVKRDAEEELRDKVEAKRQFKEKELAYGKELQQQKLEIEKECEEERANRLRKEAFDNTKADEEMEFLKRRDKEDYDKKRNAIKMEQQKHLAEQRQRDRILVQEQKEMEEVTEIYAQAKQRIDCLRKEKEKELQRALLVRREAISAQVAAIEEAKDKGEAEIIAAALAERDALEAAKIKERSEFDERMKRERIEDRQQYLKRVEREKRDAEELRKWEMLNRSKTNEIMREHEEEKRKERWEKILQVRKELLEQISEDAEEKRRNIEMERLMALVSFEKDDKLFFDYADEVMEVVKRRGLSTYPVEKVIERYRKENSLAAPRKRYCRHTYNECTK